MSYEIVTNKKKSEKLLLQEFYESSLECNLDNMAGTLRSLGREVTIKSYDEYVKRVVSNKIVSNEFDTGTIDNGRPNKKLTKKTLVSRLSTELDLPVLAVNWVYNYVFESVGLNESDKEDRKQFGLTKIENLIADLEYRLQSDNLRADEMALLSTQYKNLMELYLKVGGAMPKNETSNKFVLGNDNSTVIKSEKAQIQQNQHNEMASLAPLLEKFLKK